MKVIEKIWISAPSGTVGIVVIEDEITKQNKAYIAPVLAGNEDVDTKYVAEHGQKLTVEILQRLMFHLNPNFRPKAVIYRGKRVEQGIEEQIPGQRGEALVYKNDQLLSPKPSQKLHNHSPDGFEWSYYGSGPAQLALALLLDVTGIEDISLRLHQEFKEDIVAKFPLKGWQLTSAEIQNWLNSRLAKIEKLP